MATVTISNSPVHSQIQITYPYGVTDSGYSCGWHTGVDFAPSGNTENNPWLYPVKEGRVVYVQNNPNNSLGIQAQILDEEGHYWRYCHMVQGSLQVSVGDTVDLNTRLGRMGATGNVTGRHLHLECSTTQTWQCSTFLNPCNILGIPNVDGTIIEYDGSVDPPEPPEPPEPSEHVKTKFKWVLYARKLRKRQI